MSFFVVWSLWQVLNRNINRGRFYLFLNLMVETEIQCCSSTALIRKQQNPKKDFLPSPIQTSWPNVKNIFMRLTQSLQASYFQRFFKNTVFFDIKKISCQVLPFYLYPGAISRAYKIIKEGLIKGKLYSKPKPGLTSVHLPKPPNPMFVQSLRQFLNCASFTNDFVNRPFFAPLYNYPTFYIKEEPP